MQTHSTNQASAAAFAQVGNMTLKTEADKILDICVAAQRHGALNMSGREIQHQYELIYGKRIDAGTVSARVNALILAGRLKRSSIARACSITGRDIYPVAAPMTQARLTA